ncbi:hypothetical protein SORBI_3003G286800 [Sorghum bicolor]|uniref:DUF6598 domain-containing protein n=1 Tax=Sorghum bicolor TaxID=4558 RepID=A0A1W0VZD6_SORBI|nr:hypothetical protein SORBI_3003G286800 [Sorghum bicolor]
MDLLCLALVILVPQPGLVDNEEDDIQPDFSDEEDYLFSDADYEELKAEDVAGFIEKLGPVEHEERLTLMKASFGIPSEPLRHGNLHPLPECTRERRHVGDRVWHTYYHMSKLVEKTTDGYLRLLSPRRGMSMRFNCLIEVDIRVKATGDDGTDDKTLADSCTEIVEDQIYFDSLYRCTMSGPYGSAVFYFTVFQLGFEATIELDFLEVPEGGFNIQMCGYTIVQKNYYAFIGKNCECDSFVSSTGRFQQYFVAAVQNDDYFLVDFAEGKSPLVFKPNIHGSEEKEYSFHNGALVSVKVSWSTAFD